MKHALCGRFGVNICRPVTANRTILSCSCNDYTCDRHNLCSFDHPQKRKFESRRLGKICTWQLLVASEFVWVLPERQMRKFCTFIKPFSQFMYSSLSITFLEKHILPSLCSTTLLSELVCWFEHFHKINEYWTVIHTYIHN